MCQCRNYAHRRAVEVAPILCSDRRRPVGVRRAATSKLCACGRVRPALRARLIHAPNTSEVDNGISHDMYGNRGVIARLLGHPDCRAGETLPLARASRRVRRYCPAIDVNGERQPRAADGQARCPYRPQLRRAELDRFARRPTDSLPLGVAQHGASRWRSSSCRLCLQRVERCGASAQEPCKWCSRLKHFLCNQQLESKNNSSDGENCSLGFINDSK